MKEKIFLLKIIVYTLGSQIGVPIPKRVAHRAGGRWGRAVPRRVANEHLKGAMMLVITSYTPRYEKIEKFEGGIGGVDKSADGPNWSRLRKLV